MVQAETQSGGTMSSNRQAEQQNVGPESGRLILEDTDGHVQSGKSLEAAENSGHFIVFTYMPFFFPHFL